MGKAKNIIVKPITSNSARRIVKQLHYSGKVCANSQLHFGVFLDGKCGGALQFGPSMDKRKVQGLVEGTKFSRIFRQHNPNPEPRRGLSLKQKNLRVN